MPNSFPKICYKSALLERFNKVSRKLLLELVYEAVQLNRKYTIKQAKNTKILFKNEVKHVMIQLGEYEPEENYTFPPFESEQAN